MSENVKNRKKRTVRSEDIPRNTKAAVRRLLGRMASQKKKLTVEQLLALFSKASGSDEADDKLLLS